MPGVLVALEDIHAFTVERWGDLQADIYIADIFSVCEVMADRPRRKIPAEFGVGGYFAAYKAHIVYWREAANGDVIVVCIIHGERNLPRHVAAAFLDLDGAE